MENAMFERLELQSDDILQAYYMRSQSLLLLEYAGTLEETLGFSDSTDKPQAVLAQMAAAESPTNGEKLQQAEYFLAFTEKNGEVWLYFYSRTNAVRAVDLLDSIVEEMGLVKGNAVSASGRVPAALFKAHMTGMDAADYMEFVQGKVAEYFEEDTCIDALQYAKMHEKEILEMDRYRKKRISWAFVPTDRIAAAGTKLAVKSLENETGITIVADPDIYIMIGRRGEVYHIRRDKFLATYEPTEEPLDIFTQMLDFIPVVETVSDGGYISIDEMERLCYPKTQAVICCQELKKRTRVFSKNSEQEYFLGRPGDYLAVRLDDITDIYVIQRDIFAETYEKVQI